MAFYLKKNIFRRYVYLLAYLMCFGIYVSVTKSNNITPVKDDITTISPGSTERIHSSTSDNRLANKTAANMPGSADGKYPTTSNSEVQDSTSYPFEEIAIQNSTTSSTTVYTTAVTTTTFGPDSTTAYDIFGDHTENMTDLVNVCNARRTSYFYNLTRPAEIAYTSSRGTLGFFQDLLPGYDGVKESEYLYCNVHLNALQGMVFKINLLRESCGDIYMVVYDFAIEDENEYFIITICWSTPTKEVYSFSNKIRILLYIVNTGSSEPYSFHATFEAVPEKDAPELQMQQFSPQAGYIQSPGWDGTTHYLSRTGSCVNLNGSENHVIMISFLDFDIEQTEHCEFDFVEIFSDKDCNGTSILKACGSLEPATKVYQTSSLSVKFQSDRGIQGTGFRLVYSFHSQPSIPEQLPDGNPALECAGGEDAAVDCSIMGEICGRSSISYGTSCYTNMQVILV
ncbi:hypothetical protein BaRGS_00021574 [Batillaria attramentaria]|uniref:CUB domain-containing protein n=1 Tax=Batillaria attramentaria TaxID=370345 RepID=A0ABD0KJN7_9CAEN